MSITDRAARADALASACVRCHAAKSFVAWPLRLCPLGTTRAPV